MKRLGRRLLFSLAPLAALLVGAEVAARLLWTPPEEAPAQDYLMPPHPTRIWAPRPGATMGHGPDAARIGANGLREVSLTGAPRRALTLGDSNIFGHGLPDGQTLHAGLTRALAARGAATDVLCGGVPGYSSAQSLALLHEVGWALRPDLLVIANLLSDSTEEHFSDKEWMAWLHQPQRRAELELARTSRAWAWVRHRTIRPSRLDQRITWVRPPTLVARPRVPLPDYVANLHTMLDEAASRGVAAVIFQLVTVQRFEGRPDAPRYLEAQREVAQARGVPVVDGLDALQGSGLGASQAFIDPVHASGPTNARYADAIADALVAAGWPDRPPVPSPR